MKVIAGKYKGRRINIIVDKAIRPTRPIIREAVFSILTSGDFLSEDGKTAISDCVFLDLFSGTGSFAMEALSRGAASVILVDKDRSYLNLAKENIESIGELSKAEFICADIDRIYAPSNGAVDIVFIDPPYRKNMVLSSIEKLKKNDWLKAGSIMVIETGYREKLQFPDGFEIILSREYGNSRILIIKNC